jgi:hypothetical protein
MKKLFALVVFLLSFTATFAVNPIPSYETPCSGTCYFIESASSIGTGTLTDERREMNVESSNPTLSPTTQEVAVVYFYRLDGTRVLGPYYLPQGGFLNVKIDGKPWGVSIRCSSTFVVSVWSSIPQLVKNENTTQDYMNYNSADSWGINNVI